MKKIILLCTTILYINIALSQSDSLKEKFLLKSMQNYIENIAHLPLRSSLVGAEFGYSGVFWSKIDGDFHTVQMPETSRTYGFSSMGNRAVKSWMIEGRFEYQNQRQDSIGWKQTRDVFSTPYYFSNIKKGNWRNDVFDSYVNASRYFFDEKLALGLGVDYSLQTHSRGSDPRPLINYFYINPKIQIAYQFIPGHQIAVGGNLRRAMERGNISNFNLSNDSFGRTEYNLYTMMGGASFNLLRRPTYELGEEGFGYSLAYYFQKSQWILSNEFNYTLNSKSFVRLGIDGSQRIFEEIGIFDQEIISNKFFAQFSNSSRIIQLNAETFQNYGSDFNNIFAGNNYQRDNLGYYLKILHEFKNIKSFSILADFGVNNLAERDFNASHAYQISNMNFGAGFQLPISINEKVQLLPSLKGNYRMNILKDVNILQSQINIVSNSVFIPNIDYFSIDFVEIIPEITAKIKFKKIELNPSVYADLVTSQNSQSHLSGYFLSRGNQRNSLGISLYFIH
ncbi:hypothetical protein MM239_17720 [Belliella sp. DSM 111904]|uniref:DUF6850 domain-containing protein n=1 Tax=Belliella filtrata TaxID=2923435 RepID=A0ABS9V4W6_9BACT|nr:DUF6850 family outer membrane beta-barrel protein [Belliella filtrata]MCH7411240.1 hypothetical protein [Belliella filtrata]